MSKQHKTCFCIGYGRCELDALDLLDATIEKHITEYGVREFVVGTHARHEGWIVCSLMQAKKRHPDIVLKLLLARKPGKRQAPLPLCFDQGHHPADMPKAPFYRAKAQANRYMLEHADYLIACVQQPPRSVRHLLKHAQTLAYRLTVTMV